ncbi:MAG: Hsp20/alpha crystallin family protein [Anaerolineaceae bacterium]
MANLARRRFYPRELYNLDQFMDRFLDLSSDVWGSQPLGFPLDVVEKDEEFLVRADAAGFDPDLLEITFDNNTLSIKGEIHEENKEEKEGKYHVQERRVGTFFRSVSLPGQIEQSGISAETENGILTVHLPKKPESQPKRIEIKPKSVQVVDQGK